MGIFVGLDQSTGLAIRPFDRLFHRPILCKVRASRQNQTSRERWFRAGVGVRSRGKARGGGAN